MPDLKLTYFDFDGGRGEPARLAMILADIPFEDRRIPLTDWPTVKSEMPLGAVPVLEVDGQAITQSNTIIRYLGRLAGLYPDDPMEAALCDEVMGTVEDAIQDIVASFGIDDAVELKRVRQALVEGPLPMYLERLNSQLASRGSYFSDQRLTVADLKVYVWIRSLRSGHLDHVPVDLVDRLTPGLVDHFQRVDQQPAIARYYQGRR